MGKTKKIKEVENNLQNFKAYENLPSACQILNKKFEILFINSEWKKLFGYSFTEVEGKSFFELLINISHDRIKTLIFNMDLEGASQNIELQAKKNNGSILEIKLSTKQVKFNNDNDLYYIVIINNNFEKKSLEKRIIENEKKSKLIFDNVPGAIYEFKIDNEGFISFPFVSDVIENIYGIKSDNIYSSSTILKKIIHPDDYEILQETLKKSAESLLHWHHEFRVVQPNGNVAVIEGNASPVKHNDGSVVWYGSLRDITDILFRNEKFRKLSEAVEQSSASIVLTDLSGHIEYVNKKFQEVTGYSKEEVLGKNPRILKSGDTNSEVYEALWRTITNGKTWIGEFVNIKKNGEKYWENAVITPVLDDSGNTSGYVAIKEDITYRKKVEEALKESEEKYRGLIENMQEGLLVVDNDNIIWMINKKLCELLGYSERELIGKSILEFLASDEMRDTVVEMTMKRLEGKTEQYELLFCRKDGEKRIFLMNVSPVSSSDQIVGSSATCLDITESKKILNDLEESEKKYKRIFESLTDLYYQTDEKGIITVISPSIERISGWKASDLIGKPATFIYNNSDERDLLLHVLMEKGYVNDYELVLLNNDGTFKEISLSGRVMHDDNGKFIGVSGILRDISERKKIEKEIREKRALLDSLINYIPDLIFYKDLNGIYRGGNKSFFSFFGKDKDSVIGKSDYDIFSKDRADLFRNLDLESIASQKQMKLSEWTTYPDGTAVFLDTLKTPYFDSDGNILGILGISRDLTENKNILEALKESEEFQKNLLENLTSGVIIVDKETMKIEGVNQEAAKLLGQSIDSLIGDRCCSYLCPNNDGECPSIDGKEDDRFETVLKRKDGDIIPIYRSIKRITINGKQKYLENFFDMTEIKKLEEKLIESEQKHRLLAENVSDIIWVLDIKTYQFTYISPSIIKVSGFTSEEGMQRSLKESLSQESYEYAVNSLTDRIAEHYFDGGIHKVFTDEIELTCKDGSLKSVEASSSFIVNEKNEITAMIGVSRDIQQRKESERQLSQYALELRELNATKDKFFSIIAHDLRNPFSVIMGFVDLLKNNYGRYTDSKREEMLDVLAASAKKAYTLLENLLTWSRSQTNKILFTPIECSIDEILESCIADVKSQAEKKDIKILISANAIDNIVVDKNMITIVIRNLLTNAVKFTHRGGFVRIITKDIDLFTRISIEDTGVGIASENIEKLFQIDAKMSSVGTEGEQSSGLGLILCKEFVEKHCGTIWVESEFGKGSVFHFTIPK